METLIEKFTKFCCKLKFEEISIETVENTKKLLLDLIGVSIAGSQKIFPQMVTDYIESMGGRKESTLLSNRKKVPSLMAAFGNAVCAHALDMDDGYRYGGVHPGVSVIPAALAIGEKNTSSGKDLIVSIVCGYEIICRLAKFINPSHLKRGFHTTGTVGPFGAACASGLLEGLSERQMVNALALSGLQGAGLMEVMVDGAMAKPLNPGKAALSGVISVSLAKRGARAPATMIEGNKGFLKAMSDKFDSENPMSNLGLKFHIDGQYIKLHASCRHTHAPIDALLDIKSEHNLPADQIMNIEIETYQIALDLCGLNQYPKTVEDAKFSLRFVIAMASCLGSVSDDQFDEKNLNNIRIKKLASCINLKLSDKWEREYPKNRGATVIVHTKSGDNLKKEIFLAKGEPENPVSIDDLLIKFNKNTIIKDCEEKNKLIETCMNIEKTNAKKLIKSIIDFKKTID